MGSKTSVLLAEIFLHLENLVIKHIIKSNHIISTPAMSTVFGSISKTQKSPPHGSYVMLILFKRIYNSNLRLKLMPPSMFLIFLPPINMDHIYVL